MDLIVKEYLGRNIEFKIINGSVNANATSMASAFDMEVRSEKIGKEVKKPLNLLTNWKLWKIPTV